MDKLSTSPAAPGPVTVSLYEKQQKIHPRAVHGCFTRWRWVMVWLTQALFYGLPWLAWNGTPLVLFDLEAQRFHVFGLILYPQDFIYLTAILVIAALALFFFTAIAGRLWCGYACPQTVYTEIYLWLEYRIEGDRNARIRLDAAPWTAEKWARKAAKHAAWLALGLWTGFTFVGYFTPIRALAAETVALAAPSWALFWVVFYGFATYGNAGWMREQMCKYMCPYARFQSALLDADSLIITYDAARGEPRGARRRSTAAQPAAGRGDCVDCRMCVHVCPTGIDIRKGLQNECIGCAACIDACNPVMVKNGRPTGLIRYTTENGVSHGWTRAQMLRRVGRGRVLVYGAALAVIVVAFGVAVALRSPFRVDVIRDRNTLARVIDDGVIENVYRVQLLNATAAPQRYRISAAGPTGLAVVPLPPVAVAPAQVAAVVVHLHLPPDAAHPLRGQPAPIRFEVADERGATVREKSTFYVPR